MYLKSLEMQGFKSFPDKTKLTFERGTTVIVGPNGSGKSNISDAMRWVLGEISSKTLRGSGKMEDMIFGGADSRRPMGFAEVSVTFDNTDPENRLDCPDEEVTVTRRYYRGGDSEYFINRRARRLRDIYELFMNTGIGRDGYSIIGQGKIAEIISRKSDERRSIFEDASGIAKFRHRKNETERKLKTAEENMTRVNDVFQEVVAQVTPLEKEAEKATRALELLETKKKADVQLWLYDSEHLREQIAKAEELVRNSGYDLKLAEEAISNYNAQSDQLFEEAQSNKLKVAEVLERIQNLTKENHDRESQYQVTENTISNTRMRIESMQQSVENRRTALSAEEAEGRRRRATADELQEKLTALEDAHTKRAEEEQELANRIMDMGGAIATAFADIEERKEEVTEITVRMKWLEDGKQSDSDKHETMQSEIASYRTTSETLDKQRKIHEQAAEGYRAQMDEADKGLVEFDKKLYELGTLRDELVASENESVVESDIARQRIEAYRAMEEHFEGYGHAVRFVMEQYAAGKITDASGRKCGKIYGPLSKVIRVDKKYVTAMDIALGVNLQHIVVEDESVAKNAIYALKHAEAGHATFFPISSMRAQTVTAEMEEAAECKGYIGIASELVECEDKFREIVGSLLGRTVVFDNLDNATEMARKTKFRVKVVTLDGQVINAGGSFTGGSRKQKGGILSRTGEIAALTEKLKKLTADLEKIKQQRAELDQSIKEMTDDRTDLDNRRQLLATLYTDESSNAAQYTAKWEANESLITKMQGDFEALERQRAGYDEELAQLAERQKLLRRQIEEIGAARAEKDVERNELLSQKEAMEKEQTERYIAISGVRKDLETAATYIAESDARANTLREEIAAREQQIADMKKSIVDFTARQEANRNTHAEGERVIKELQAKYARLNEGDMAFQQKLASVNSHIQSKMAEKENYFRAHTKNENRLAALREEQEKLANRFWEDYEMSRNEALALGYEMITAEERPAVQELQVSCRNRLRAIGNVDLGAVEKYKELKERHDAMATQIADMTAARDDLLAIIRDLENEMRSSFMTTFEQINKNFNVTFNELFGGGNAELSLSDPEDVLTSGIEIKAAPPGKIIKNLVQLSGGEQSFIAIALLFAIMQVNPTPFFILDEIEAALDEVNVARFAAYIKRYSLDTQFLLITHRRGTMEAANRLYGVTMPERGISKVLTLDVNSIQGKGEGDDWNGIFSQAT
ncbi:MAG: chromosome segregation protein SMC [Ruminococcaceae bacterium]|nr:chromosome segregation protein SMC [Oscillospiraceae bacterium]